VIGLRNSTGRHGGAVSATAASLPGRFPDCRIGNLIGRGHEGFVLRQRSVFQNVLWIGVPVDVFGAPLAAPARADLLPVPVPLGERWIAVFIVMRRVVEEIFVGADAKPVHDRGDAWNSARYDDRLMRLVFGVHPARQLDDAVFDGADVDRSLAERRIVSERLEHSLLELLGAVERCLGRVELLIEVGIELILVQSLVIEIFFFSFGPASECVLDSVSQSLESSESFRHEDACRKAGRGSNGDVDRGARRRLFLIFFIVDVRRLVAKAEGQHSVMACGEGYLQTIAYGGAK
jgi:hypothetical protein